MSLALILLMALALLLLPALVLGGAIAIGIHLGHRKTGTAPVVTSEIARAWRSAQHRALTAIGLAIVAFAMITTVGLNSPSALGIPVMLAAPLSCTLGMIVYGALPPSATPRSGAVPRSAPLEPRGVLTFFPRRDALMALVMLSSVILMAVVLGISAHDEISDAPGRSISFASTDMTSSASPYFGWFYSVPLMGACAVLALATAFALRRVSSTPVIGDAGSDEADAIWRRETNRILTRVMIAGCALPLGPSAVLSGMAMHRAALPTTSTAWSTFAVILSVLGLALLVNGFWSIVTAAMHATLLPQRCLRGGPMASHAGTSAAVAAGPADATTRATP